ncbi:DUF4870 domain-containing protein [Naasia lichenicola]|uniref:DUF4870 domain-containing protein n=2 Tax=Naasia lichenicola TaxID=2565933 RepID=A0A4S4FFU5_9MICO|nr:DUF4870 domain-containing protein [Naasia lichenicola]
MSPEDQRLYSTLLHIAGIFFSWLSALIGYLLLKDRGGFIRDHARQELNWQLTVTGALIVSYILFFLVIGFFTLIAVYILAIVFGILSAMAANRGEHYRFPLAIQFIKA